ncbi:AAA family ATPase [Spirosoma soli]|uniref:AAA family ATPase n=1 Tax=Spirosoma soli TaxID=1770529 RepID=A0ABW5LZI3_9BACT
MENNTPNTNNFLNWVEIKNFKSIKDLRLDCKRVNVFIGKPNVGKSNILEGLGLLGVEYGTGKFMGGFARYETVSDFFYDKDVLKGIYVESDQPSLSAALAKPSIILNEFNTDFSYEYYLGDSDSAKRIASSEDIQINEDESEKAALGYSRHNFRHFSLTKEGKVSQFAGQGNYITKYKPGFVRKYDFGGLTTFTESSFPFLIPPDGNNLFSVISRNEALKDEFAKLFADQRLELVLSNFDQNFELQKKEGFYVTKFPFFSVADTFRRFMFYITAIESNKDSVIIFEEPEVHSFPPYTQDIAYRMIYSEENQFFVSTHSPYLLQTLVSNLSDDQLNVFVTYYENYETKVKALTSEELGFVQEYSADVFFNLDRFVPNAQSANPA